MTKRSKMYLPSAVILEISQNNNSARMRVNDSRASTALRNQNLVSAYGEILHFGFYANRNTEDFAYDADQNFGQEKIVPCIVLMWDSQAPLGNMDQ